ncbi:MAG TPA: DUF488 domain-containing protein [Thermoanaerobaculia bacterium]|jgi:uncharacterized protein (DUF488 family)|nr:DUF488 domain-containing protein [Thermoanaerobaculia bacterium]
MAAALYTIGHSTRSGEELLGLLAEHGIATLVDVRRFPASRRHPQFARQALAASLAGAGIAYVHEPDLGGRRQPRPDSPHTAWRVPAFRGYADHMGSAPFSAALGRLLRLAERSRTVILCAEAVPWRCHRRLIADAATAAGAEVLHILAPGRGATPHQLDAAARVVVEPADGAARLIYDVDPAAPPMLPFP